MKALHTCVAVSSLGFGFRWWRAIGYTGQRNFVAKAALEFIDAAWTDDRLWLSAYPYPGEWETRVGFHKMDTNLTVTAGDGGDLADGDYCWCEWKP